MDGKSSFPLSRREFARRAAILSAVALVPPSPPPMYSAVGQPAPQQPSDTPSLSPESQAEAEARYQAILVVYGSRLADAQKLDLRRLSFTAQPPLDRLRAYEIENGDGPALYLKPLVEREKTIAPVAIPHSASQPANKP